MQDCAHPNIVPTYDFGQDGDKLFLASEFVAGSTLQGRIEEGPVTPREVAEWVAKIADAVYFAHERGIIHRDIKPHNILIDDRGEPQLTDFGLARRTDDESNLTLDGSVMGTPAYMSPEQHEVTMRKSDLRAISTAWGDPVQNC
ncbi:MAG: serine/threonine-protein kinase [Planctomycetaceae bacterium]